LLLLKNKINYLFLTTTNTRASTRQKIVFFSTPGTSGRVLVGCLYNKTYVLAQAPSQSGIFLYTKNISAGACGVLVK